MAVDFVCDYSCPVFEIQTPGIEADAGQQFLTQRFYITCQLGGSSLTPIIIVDGMEYVLPDITNVGRSTIELPFQKFGRFLDGVRLYGRPCNRIEVFRVEMDIWYGEGG